MESRNIGRIVAVLLAVLAFLLFILIDSGIKSKSGNPESDLRIYFFFYCVAFLFLFFSRRRWLRIVSLIVGILLIIGFIVVLDGYTHNIVFFIVVPICCLASYIVAIICPKKSEYE